MKAAGVFVLIYISALSTTANANGKCEENENNDTSFGTSKTCYMMTTVIDSKDFSITTDRDESVEKFNAQLNKQVAYLPNNLGAKFPSLLRLNADGCSIKELSKDNFKGLGKLRALWISQNQLEKIDDDTFEHIPAVEQIHLRDNKIKKLNGRAFASLHELTSVHLASNECINESFEGATRIAELPLVVTGRCGFTLCEQSQTRNVKSEADLMAQSELQALKIEFAKLEAKAELQIAHHNELQAQHNEINAQLKETCDARIELKVQEISNLSNDLQTKSSEINEKNEKIKQCEKRIQILGGDGP